MTDSSIPRPHFVLPTAASAATAEVEATRAGDHRSSSRCLAPPGASDPEGSGLRQCDEPDASASTTNRAAPAGADSSRPSDGSTEAAPAGETEGGLRGRLRGLLHSRFVLAWLVVLSFLENTVLLIAIEPLFIPVIAARRKQWALLASLLVLGCLFGALATYALAAALFEPFVEPALESLGFNGELASARQMVEANGFWGLFVIGVTPIPFQLGTTVAGSLRVPLHEFVLAIVLSRSVRYFGLGLLVYAIGARAQTFVERRQLEIVVGSVALCGLMVAAAALVG